MRKVQKGFTLVELIVVITILAILGTIAFISLQGYSQDAKNSKVASDIRSIVSAIETSLTQGPTSVHDLNDNSLQATHGEHITNAGTFASGVTLSGSTSQAGYINFIALGQNGDDFVDANGNSYIIGSMTNTAVNPNTASTATENFLSYQVVGEKGSADTRQAVVKGNYVAAGSDVGGLVSLPADTTAVTNDLSLSATLYP